VDKLVTTRSERFWNPEALARDQWIKRQAETLAAGSQVLDAGAGASKYRPMFAHCEYKTQDFCEYRGPQVKYLQPIDFVCDITAIPLPPATLDAILCTEVFEHLVDPLPALDEFARLLKPGGKLLLTAPLISYLHMEPYHYFGGFTHYWYRHWLPPKGFEIESITPVGGPGQSCVNFGNGFYAAWAAAEKKTRGPARWFSRGLRAGAKPVIHYLLPWLLRRCDRHLSNELICSEYMVAARKLPERAS
jgi:SAM-dependent methyltransferase